MQELLSVFLAVGMKSDQDFGMFRDLDAEVKITVFGNLQSLNLKLNPFQQMMLQVMIRHLNV
jgi:hypothetical protein